MSNKKWYRGKMNLFKWVFIPALLAVWVVSCKKKEIEKLNPEQNNALLAKLYAWNEANPATYKLPEAFLRAGSKTTENPDTPQPFYLDFDNLKTFASEDGKQILVIPVLRELKVDYTEEVAFVRRAVLEVDAEGNVLKSAVIEIVAEMAPLQGTDRKDEIIRDVFRGENTDPALYYAITYDFNYNLISGKTYQGGIVTGDIEPVVFINTDYQRSITQKCGKTMVLMQVAYPCPGAPTAPINGGNGGDGNGGNSDEGHAQGPDDRIVSGQKYASKLTCFTYVWATVDGEPCDTNTGNGVDPGTTSGAPGTPGTPTPTTPTNPTPTSPTKPPIKLPKDITWDDLDPGDNTVPPKKKPISDKLKAILNADSTTLTKDELLKLDSVLTEFIERSCVNEAIYNYMVSKNVKLRFSIIPTQGVPGAFYHKTNKIGFGRPDCIKYQVFAEEFFHSYQNQFYPNGLTPFLLGDNKGRSNMEFEAKLHHDLIEAQNPYPEGFIGIKDPNSPVTMEYTFWMYDNFGEDFPHSFDDIADKYSYFINHFVIFTPDYNFPILDNYLSEALFNVINSSECND